MNSGGGMFLPRCIDYERGEKMQAIKGYLSNGLFTPSDEVGLPSHARVVLIIEEEIDKPKQTLPFIPDEADKKARTDWLIKVEEMLKQSRDEDLSYFPRQETVKNPEDYPWFD